MTFAKPVAAYNAANGIEAHLVCNLLNDAEIEAIVIDDVSAAGVWLGGMLPEIYKPQVWIEQADIDRARPVLVEYEQRLAARQISEPATEVIEATCDECGERSSFPVSQKGTVQNCPRCNAYVDVGDDASVDEWQEVPNDETADA